MPTTLHVILNFACQAKCPFCYNPPLTPELARWRLPIETLARQLMDRRREGYSGVTFSGGEVTLLRELPIALRLARKTGYSTIGLITNGLRLAEPAYADSLLRAGLDFCCLSVHAADAALHDRLVAVPGAFPRVLAALENLRARRVPLLLNYVLVRENLSATVAFIERFAGLENLVEFQIYFPHFDGLMALNAPGLGLRMREAVPWLLRARDAALARGVTDKLWFYNLPPCAAPELGPHLRNWEREASVLIDPRGVSEGRFEPSLERKDRVKGEPCRRCVAEPRCLGFERAYVDRFGEEEMRSLSEAP